MIEAAKTSAVAIKAATAAAAASDGVVDDVAAAAADAHPDREDQPADAPCRRLNTLPLKVATSNAPTTRAADTTSAVNSLADSKIVVHNLAALTIAAPKAEVPGPLGLPNPARKTKSFCRVNLSRNIATSL